MNIQEFNVTEIAPYDNNPRNNEGAVSAVAQSIQTFGFKVPIVIDKDMVVVAGHTRLKAAKHLGLTTVPCIIADDLTPEQIKAFRLADNKVGGLATWDMEKLERELDELAAMDVDMSGLGFEIKPDAQEDDDFEIEEALEAAEDAPETEEGDVWR